MKRIKKTGKRALVVAKQRLCMFAPRDPVYIFHHIPKCGGTSLIDVLDNWFIPIRDYRAGWTMNYPKPVNISRLRSCHCLCGHFELDGYYLHQRYPEVFNSSRYRIFTFVRDPLKVQASLFRYETMNGQSKANNIEEHLFIRQNYMANRFPATLDNYKEVINRYFFVGILEHGDASVATLASMMGKRFKPLPWKNKSHREVGAGCEQISQEVITRFKNQNTLDYLIYNYCVEKFKRISAEQGAALDGNSAVLH